MKRFTRARDNGFGFLEVTIGAALTSVVLVGAYRFSSQIYRKNAESVRSANSSSEHEWLIHRLSNQIRNAVAIPFGESTILSNLSPPSYTCLSSDGFPSTPPSQAIAHGLLPFPGYSLQTMPQEFNPINPSDPSLVSASNSDAVRIVYLASDSVQLDLVEAVSGEDPIHVSGAGSLEKGDYAVINDDSQADLFRITQLEQLSDGSALLWHSSASNWNLSLIHEYRPERFSFVQKVEVVDYAHDPQTATLFHDPHKGDDGFDPAGQTFGFAGRVFRWTAMARGIERFRIYYEVLERGAVKQTRTPRAGLPTDTTPCSSNQVGYPNLRFIQIEMSANKEVLVRNISPDNLKRSALRGEGENLEGERIAIAPPPPDPSTIPSSPPEEGGEEPPTGPPNPSEGAN